MRRAHELGMKAESPPGIGMLPEPVMMAEKRPAIGLLQKVVIGWLPMVVIGWLPMVVIAPEFLFLVLFVFDLVGELAAVPDLSPEAGIEAA